MFRYRSVDGPDVGTYQHSGDHRGSQRFVQPVTVSVSPIFLQARGQRGDPAATSAGRKQSDSDTDTEQAPEECKIGAVLPVPTGQRERHIRHIRLDEPDKYDTRDTVHLLCDASQILRGHADHRELQGER